MYNFNNDKFIKSQQNKIRYLSPQNPGVNDNDLANIGVARGIIPDDFFEYLTHDYDNLSGTVNNDLAGHISYEYDLNYKINDEVNKFFQGMVSYYPVLQKELYEYKVLSHDCPVEMHTMWTNFQSKGDFNPLHRHSGIYSFIIFVNIPYDLKTELKRYKKPQEENATSKLSFVFTRSNGQIGVKHIPVERSYEKTIFMFPAKLWHCVYPFFSSDDYRVTISGNMRFNTRSDK